MSKWQNTKDFWHLTSQWANKILDNSYFFLVKCQKYWFNKRTLHLQENKIIFIIMKLYGQPITSTRRNKIILKKIKFYLSFWGEILTFKWKSTSKLTHSTKMENCANEVSLTGRTKEINLSGQKRIRIWMSPDPAVRMCRLSNFSLLLSHSFTKMAIMYAIDNSVTAIRVMCMIFKHKVTINLNW